MRALIAILALLVGIAVGQPAGDPFGAGQHAEGATPSATELAETAAPHGDASDCAGCPEADASKGPCVGTVAGCTLALAALPASLRLDTQLDLLAKTLAPPSGQTPGGLALGVDTPPPRSAG